MAESDVTAEVSAEGKEGEGRENAGMSVGDKGKTVTNTAVKDLG
jgi:hypothetical protein